MLTPRKFAAKHNVAYTTVATWLQHGQLPEAIKVESPAGGHLWAIPETAKIPTRGRGRPKRVATSKKTSK